MKLWMDFLFKSGVGYDDLVNLIEGNPRYVFFVSKQDRIDKRTKKSKEKGWVTVQHKGARLKGEIKLIKDHGVCSATIDDQSGGMLLIGAWTSWLTSNASDLISGMDLRIE